MSRSRPPSPPRHATANGSQDVPMAIEVTIEPGSPMSTSSTDSASGIASPKETSAFSRKSSTSMPTNTLIITPLPLAFFEPRILDALKSHFASFSTTFIHQSSPYSPARASGPGADIKGSRQNGDADAGAESDEQMDDQSMEGDLYSFVPLKSFKRAIVVYYSVEDAERARIASDRLHIPATPKSPAVTMRAFRGPATTLVEDGWFPKAIRRDSQGISDDAEEGGWYFGGYPMFPSNPFDEGEIRESPFHLRPPVPERNFLISPPGSPPVGWVATREDPPNDSPLAEDLVEALERLKAQSMAHGRRRRSPREDRLLSGSGSRSRSISDASSVTHSDEEGVMLIPESAAGLSVRVEDWTTRQLAERHQARDKEQRRVDSSTDSHALLSEMEEDLDRELDDTIFGKDKIDWNRRDHANTTIIPPAMNDGASGVDIQVEEPVDNGPQDSPFLTQNQMFHSGRNVKVQMPKLGVKPKPASMPPLQPELDMPGPGSVLLGFTPNSMPPLRPTAMPPLQSDNSPH